jgi:hypothetical protein
MTIIKNHSEVFFFVISKKQGNGIIESKVGQFTHICQLNISCGQDSVCAIVPATIFLVNLSNSHIGELPFD